MQSDSLQAPPLSSDSSEPERDHYGEPVVLHNIKNLMSMLHSQCWFPPCRCLYVAGLGFGLELELE